MFIVVSSVQLVLSLILRQLSRNLAHINSFRLERVTIRADSCQKSRALHRGEGVDPTFVWCLGGGPYALAYSAKPVRAHSSQNGSAAVR